MRILIDLRQSNMEVREMSECYFRTLCDCICDEECSRCEMYFPLDGIEEIAKAEYQEVLHEFMEQLCEDIQEYE